MFFSGTEEFKREVVVNVLGEHTHGRTKFLKETYGLNSAEIPEIRMRVNAAIQPRAAGRPRNTPEPHSTETCAECQEKDADLRALRAKYEAERERGMKDLMLQAAVSPDSVSSIPSLLWAAFRERRGVETVRTFIQKACSRAIVFMDSVPWAEKIRRLGADELFARKTPILNCVEPVSMAVPVLQRGPDRTAETWRKVFERFPHLEVVASDRGGGIVAAVAALGVLSQGDPWHAGEELRNCLGAMERDAYRRIAEEYRTQKDLDRRKREGRPCKRARQAYQRARKRAAKTIRRFDRAREAKPLLEQALAPLDREGHWISLSASTESIHKAVAILQEVEAPYRRKVANAYDPDHILTFKAFIEAPLDFDTALPFMNPEEFINIAATLTWPRPTEPKAELLWEMARLLDQKLTASCPTWPGHRARIQYELEHLFRSSSLSEAINSRIRVAQQVLKHLGGKFLVLLALAHNATPFRGGKRRGRSPFQILGIQTPPGTWLDWVRPD